MPLVGFDGLSVCRLLGHGTPNERNRRRERILLGEMIQEELMKALVFLGEEGSLSGRRRRRGHDEWKRDVVVERKKGGRRGKSISFSSLFPFLYIDLSSLRPGKRIPLVKY